MSTDAGVAALESPRPDPVLLQQLRPCATVLLRDPQRFLARLHQHLDGLVPGGLQQLPDEGRTLCERIAWGVLAAPTGELGLDDAEAVLEHAGSENFRDGFPADQYLAVGHALLRAVADTYAGEWSTTLGSTWIAYYAWVRAHLLRGAALAQEAAWAREAEQGRQAGGPWTGELDVDGAGAARHARGDVGARTGVDTDDDRADDLDDEDEDDGPGYGELMVSMTLNSRRERPRHPR